MAAHRNRRASFQLLSSIFIVVLCVISAQFANALPAELDIPKIQAGAQHGSIAEQIELGAAYFTGRGVARDLKQAAYWYERAANSGDPRAQVQVGYFYQAGIGVERNPASAARWFERAAASGSTRAKVNLGVAYFWGLGVHKDPEFAAQLFKEAAKKGDGGGACYLGDMYYFGLGIPRDIEEARHWFEVGSKLHSPMAKFDLALTLMAQQDHPSQKEALKLLRESAAAGYVRAKHQLALMLVREPALEEAQGEARATLEEAAADGFWKSSIVLGILARDGRSGVPQDKKSAYYHFKIASLQGGDSASKMVANDVQLLRSTLSESEIQSLDSEASSWVSKHDRTLQFADMQGQDSQHFPAVAMEAPDGESHAGMLFGAPVPEEWQ